MITEISEFISSSTAFIGISPVAGTHGTQHKPRTEVVRVLDYACGPGTVTNALLNYADEFIGIDLSENMIKAYKTRFGTEDALSSHHFQAFVGNLLDEHDVSPAALSDSNFYNFDLVAVGLGFHHFEHLEEATKRLVDRLRPGGVFMIVDFLPHAKGDHKGAHTVSHHGFNEHRVQELFRGAGLEDTGLVVMNRDVYLNNKTPRRAFIARGRKTA